MRRAEKATAQGRVIVGILAIALAVACVIMLASGPIAYAVEGAVAALGTSTPTSAVPIESMADDSATTEAIEDEATPLASFETPATTSVWPQLLMALGVTVTVACALMALHRRHGEVRDLDDFETHVADPIP